MKTKGLKEKILDVSARLFYEQGYNSTGINQIIAEADIAKASLYHHFPSKTDILLTYLQEKDILWFEELEVFLERWEEPKDKLLGIFEFRVMRQVRAKFGGCLFVKVSAEISPDHEKVFELLTAHKARLKSLLANLINQLDTNFNQVLPSEMLATALFLLMEGATVEVNINKNENALLKAKDIARNLLNQT